MSTVSPAEGVCRKTRLPKNWVTSTLSPAAGQTVDIGTPVTILVTFGQD